MAVYFVSLKRVQSMFKRLARGKVSAKRFFAHLEVFAGLSMDTDVSKLLKEDVVDNKTIIVEDKSAASDEMRGINEPQQQDDIIEGPEVHQPTVSEEDFYKNFDDEEFSFILQSATNTVASRSSKIGSKGCFRTRLLADWLPIVTVVDPIVFDN